MADTVEKIVQTTFTLVDKTTTPLRVMASGAARITSMFDRASSIVGSFGTVAAAAGAAFSVGSAVKGTMELLTNVKKLQNITGLSAETAGSLIDVFEDMGVEAHETTRAIVSITRAGRRMEDSLDRSKGTVNLMAGRYKALGIDIDKGPVAVIKRMSMLAQKNNLSAQDLSEMYRMMPDTASRFLEVLKQGPREITKQMEQFKKLNIATDENVKRQELIRVTGLRIKSAWGDITSVIAVKLLPVIAQMMGQVADKLETWVPQAVKFGETLGRFLQGHLETVKLIGKALMVNFLLMKVTGTGIVGNAGKVTGFVKSVAGLFTRGGAMAAAGAGTAAAASAAGGGAAGAGAAGAGAGAAGAAGGAGAGAGAGAGGAGAGAAAVGLGPILAAVAAIAAVVGLVYATFKGIRDNVDGVRTRLVEAWERVTAHLKVTWALIKPLFDRLKITFNKDSPIGRFFMTMLPRVFSAYLEHAQKVLQAVNTIIIYATELEKMVMSLWGATIGGWQGVVDTVTAGWKWVITSFDEWVATPIIRAWRAITDAYNTYLAEPISGAWAKISGFFKTWLLDPIANALNAIFKWISQRIRPWADAMEGFQLDLGWLQPAADLLSASWDRAGAMADASYQSALRMREAADRAAATAAHPTPRERGMAPVYDFRNSRFDVKQMFAEGFDPDRIAVAFTNDLATLGERKVQSGLSPLFAVR